MFFKSCAISLNAAFSNVVKRSQMSNGPLMKDNGVSRSNYSNRSSVDNKYVKNTFSFYHKMF